MILRTQKYLTKGKSHCCKQSGGSISGALLPVYQQLKEIMVISNGSNYEQSLLHILENIVPEAVSDAEIILHTMICSGGIMR